MPLKGLQSSKQSISSSPVFSVQLDLFILYPTQAGKTTDVSISLSVVAVTVSDQVPGKFQTSSRRQTPRRILS